MEWPSTLGVLFGPSDQTLPRKSYAFAIGVAQSLWPAASKAMTFSMASAPSP